MADFAKINKLLLKKIKDVRHFEMEVFITSKCCFWMLLKAIQNQVDLTIKSETQKAIFISEWLLLNVFPWVKFNVLYVNTTLDA